MDLVARVKKLFKRTVENPEWRHKEVQPDRVATTNAYEKAIEEFSEKHPIKYDKDGNAILLDEKIALEGMSQIGAALGRAWTKGKGGYDDPGIARRQAEVILGDQYGAVLQSLRDGSALELETKQAVERRLREYALENKDRTFTEEFRAAPSDEQIAAYGAGADFMEKLTGKPQRKELYTPERLPSVLSMIYNYMKNMLPLTHSQKQKNTSEEYKK